MENNRGVVSLESRKFDQWIAFRLVTTNRRRSDQYIQRRWVVVIMGLALLSLSGVYGALPARAQSEKTTEEVKRPALQIGSALRFNEDWSLLKGADLSRTDDFWDRLKYIPLTQDASVWLSFGGQARLRLEYFNQFQWGASEPKQSDAYLLSRLRLSADLHVTPYLRLYVEGNSALVPANRDLHGKNRTAYHRQNRLVNCSR